MSEWVAGLATNSGGNASVVNQAMVRYAQEHGARAEIRDEGDVAVFCDCTVPDGKGRRLSCEINVVRNFQELRAVLGY